MKKIILLLTFCICFILVPKKSSAQTNNQGYLIIKTYQSYQILFNKIIVSENGSALEQIKLPALLSEEAIEPSQLLIHKMLDKYKNKGYKLVSVSSGSQIIATSRDVLITTYIFEKE